MNEMERRSQFIQKKKLNKKNTMWDDDVDENV